MPWIQAAPRVTLAGPCQAIRRCPPPLSPATACAPTPPRTRASMPLPSLALAVPSFAPHQVTCTSA